MRKVLYIFGLLTDGDIEWMAKNGTCQRLSDGEVLIEEGGKSDSLILLLEGELRVSARGYGDVARMGVGEIVGEVSLVDSAPPSATITAHGDGLALFLDKRQLLEKLEHDESFGSRFYRALAVFLWTASVAKIPPLHADDPLKDWIDRGFDLYGGLGRHPGMHNLFGLPKTDVKAA